MRWDIHLILIVPDEQMSVELIDKVHRDIAQALAQYNYAQLKPYEGYSHCPNCGRTLSAGDGYETPPIYCKPCGLGWHSPNDPTTKEQPLYIEVRNGKPYTQRTNRPIIT